MGRGFWGLLGTVALLACSRTPEVGTACSDGETRCDGDLLLRCVDGDFAVWESCDARGAACVLLEGTAACWDPSDTTIAGDTGSDTTLPTSDSSFDTTSQGEDTLVDTGDSATNPVDTADSATGPIDTADSATGPADTADSATGTSDTADSATGTSDTADSATGPGDTSDSDTGPVDTADSESAFVPPDPLRIQAECAFGAGTGDCTGAQAVDGFNSQGADNPQLENGDTTVGYIDSGTWLAYPDIDLTGFNHVVLRAATDNGAGVMELRLDSPTGPLVAQIPIPHTGGWTSFVDVPASFARQQGVHTLYVVGGGSSVTGIGNLDWIELSYEAPPVYLDPTASVADRVEDLLSRMTLEEKVGQMAQGSVSNVSLSDVTNLGLGSVLAGGGEGPSPYTPQAWANHTAAYQQAALNTRLGIPLLYGIDAVHGHAKVYGATILPHNIGLGATRDPDLVRQLGRVTAVEMAATGCHWTFAPAVSVARDERWGRTYESFGEHPEIATAMTAYIEGLQGDDLSAADAVLACAKHYVGDGGAMWGTGDNLIDQGDAVMSESALRAIHLPPYFAAVEKGVLSVMPSYSSFNGTKMHQNSYLLTDVLRQEIGFAGFTISDWDAIDQLTGATFADKIVQALDAGVDMFMLPDRYDTFIATVLALVGSRISEARIDEAVRRILTAKFATGLFEHPFGDSSLLPQVGAAAHRALARRAVRESLVLLKNANGFLPLSPDEDVCLTGSGADDVAAQAGGWTLGWQSAARTPQGESIREALDALLAGHSGSRTQSGCRVGITVVTEAPSSSYAEFEGDTANPHLDNSDSCPASDGCVAVILAGRPVDVEDLLGRYQAVVMAWLPGSEGGGVVDVLYAVDGANFTGTLPMTWKRDAVNTPVNYCGNGPAALCDDTGDHYTDPANPPASVLFPYGYGLTY